MNKNKLSLFAMLIMAMMFSCTNDNELTSSKSEYVNSVRVTVEDFQPESTSRTAYTVDGTGFHFQWVDGDALGIYPVGGDQVKFPISAGDGANTAAFDGGAWKLRSEYQYAAYYPFSANNYTISEKSLPVSYTGQAQNGDGSTAHLSKYDYLACAATTHDGSGGVDLTMKHLGAFVRLQLTMPKADTYSSVVLESDGAEFVTAGTFDLTAATPAITPTETSSTYTINLTNISTTEKDQVITVYTIVAPANLSTSNIKVTVHGTGQTTYVQTVQGKNFVARSAYNFAIDNFPSGTNASGEDVGWEESATTGMENGHEWVDLGLSVKWATCNVGASKQEDYGIYYAWGETSGYPGGYNDKNFGWLGYKWCNGAYNTLTKYCTESTFGVVDNKTILESEDDVASVRWRSSWRMPTKLEWEELYNRNNCSWIWTTKNDVKGYEITSKKNNSSIFLPAAGYINAYGFTAKGDEGHYWSCSLRTSQSETAHSLNCGYGFSSVASQDRCLGLTVRPVCQ